MACANVGRSPSAAAGRRALTKPGRASANPARGLPAASGRAKKRRRTLLVLPESELQEEPADRHASRTPLASPMPDMAPGLVSPGSAEEECPAEGAAGSTSEVVADSLEIGQMCGACGVDDAMDDVSSADIGQPHAQQAQREALLKQQQQQQQAQPLSLVTGGKQGRAVGSTGQSAGLGQLLSGDIQWVGPAIDPPTQLGSAPLQHQTYYKAFSRVCSVLSPLLRLQLPCKAL